jgi:putative endonuclease
MSNQQTGQQGETLAAAYLQQQGYDIITRNWHCPVGELDIIARQAKALVFVEVRTRRAVTSETAFASISIAKRQRLMAAIYAYLQAHDLENADWRVDVVAVALQRHKPPLIEHLEDALDW